MEGLLSTGPTRLVFCPFNERRWNRSWEQKAVQWTVAWLPWDLTSLEHHWFRPVSENGTVSLCIFWIFPVHIQYICWGIPIDILFLNISTHITGKSMFLAARSSSSTTVVRPSVGWLVGWLVIFVKKWTLEYQKAIKTYLPTYLGDISDSSESSDGCYSCDSSDSSHSSHSSDSSYHTTLWLRFCD